MNRTAALFAALAALTVASSAHAQGDAIGAPPSAARAPVASAPTGTLQTDELSVRISSANGGLVSAALSGARFNADGKPADLVTTDKPDYLSLGVELEHWNADAPFNLEQLSPRALRLTAEHAGLRVVRKVEAGSGPYQLWLTTRVENVSATPQNTRFSISAHHYVSREAEGSDVPLLPVRSNAVGSAVCRHGEELERETRDSLEAPLSFAGNVQFGGVEDVYFLTALAPETPAEVERCTMEASNRGGTPDSPHGALFTTRLTHKPLTLAPGASHTYKTLAYVGPKLPDELSLAGHGLKGAIQSGWFASLAEGLTALLRIIHDKVGNWGIAIILLTLLVKTLLFPLTMKQMQSMARMKELKPDLDRINELYADDREKKGAAIMELYRQKSINPMAGCFPVLLQLPIWISLYASLSSNVELLHAPFALWWSDLSSPDPFFVLPLALGLLMFVQQKMAPSTAMDPVQAKMMLYMMPIMMTSFMLFLPAGLCLYTLTNSALSIGQQRLIEAQLARSASSNATNASPPSSSSSSEAPDEQSTHLKRFAANRPGKAERRSRRGK